MLGLKAPSQMYMEAHAGNYALMRLKGDDRVNHALDSRLERENKWKRKFSTVKEADKIFKENRTNRNIITNTDELIGLEKVTTIEKAKKVVKESIKEEVLKTWNSRVKDLTMQGDFIQLLAEEEENVTWKSLVYNVPKGILPFALKACTNTLNTPDNLKRWGKRKFAKCALCGNHCTLQHILNFCSTSLNQGRTKWRHDSVLKHFTVALQEAKPVNIEMFADLPGHWMNGATIPADILCTLERPDVVLVERNLRRIVLLELTCSFESNSDKANLTKKKKYRFIKTDLEKAGFRVDLVPFEIGSRGHINRRNRCTLEHTLKQNQFKVNTNTLFKDMSKISLLCSFIIFQAQGQPTWQDPPLLTP